MTALASDQKPYNTQPQTSGVTAARSSVMTSAHKIAEFAQTRLAACTPQVANAYERSPTELLIAGAHDRERGLLGEIGGLADRVRDLRRTDARSNKAQIKDLTGDLRVKWDEMRALRAPVVSGDVSRRYHGHYD